VFFELARPGAVLPGVVGALCLVLGLSGLQMLPIHGAGVVLVILGSGFLIAEAFFPSHGGLGVGGLIALVAGMTMLTDPGAGLGVSAGMRVAVAIVAAAFLALVVRAALHARRRPLVGGGREELIGTTAQVEAWPSAEAGDAERPGESGWVRLQGELWRAHSALPLAGRRTVRVIGVDGLRLEVEVDDKRQGGER
jgi:membrane-bound serine protease (ClpP class)